MSEMNGFVLPPYPYDRLAPLADLANEHVGGAIDCSVGTPCDEPPKVARDAMAVSKRLAGYPPSIGTPDFREAAARWLERRFAVSIEAKQIAACMGTKEFVVDLPHHLRLRNPARDTVLFPAVSYPSYAMGASIAGCRAVPVAMDDQWRIDLDSIDPNDISRALCLWVNTPGNPAGGLDDLDQVVAWGKRHDVLIISDECYIEFTWDARDGAGPVAPMPGVVPGRTILSSGTDGVIALHSLSKRSNFAGARVGFYTGDHEIVAYLSEVRKHAGRMVPGPIQDAAVAAFDDDQHVELQRGIYWNRLNLLRSVLEHFAVAPPLPGGGFYLWIAAPNGDAWDFARRLATSVGLLVSPGEFYGPAATDFVRVAAVQPDERLDLLATRVARNQLAPARNGRQK